ncbi:MAG: hypothetical protein C5B50_25435 [Verrucomicrobia bacterium]|nr:MAG: hypothetical protein C5B50_25435 [Verrucomicrobiota bacterium]
MNGNAPAGFVVWGVDLAPYGPVELPTLVSWIKDERVLADTWVYTVKAGAWQKAAEILELQMFFSSKAPARQGHNRSAAPAISPKWLRRVKILATLSEAQLERLGGFMEIQKVPQWATVVREGESGDGMFFILEGEFRVRTHVAGRETVLATLGTGEFFGDMGLLDRGPRSADVVANTDGMVAMISRSSFERVAAEAQDLAAPLALAMGKTLSARIRKADKRLTDSLRLACAVA